MILKWCVLLDVGCLFGYVTQRSDVLAKGKKVLSLNPGWKFTYLPIRYLLEKTEIVQKEAGNGVFLNYEHKEALVRIQKSQVPFTLMH